MRPRRLLIIATATAGAVAPALPAHAQGPGGWVDVNPERPEIEVGARDENPSDGATGSSGGGGCQWSRVPDGEIEALWWSVGVDGAPVLHDEHGDIADPADFEWYWLTCPDGQGGQVSDLVPVPRDAPPVDPTVLRDEAVDLLELPSPAIAMNPGGDQVVHVATWLWIDDAIWQTHEESVTAGGVTTTVTATPQRVLWDLGNGDVTVCDGPGIPYDTTRPSGEQTTDCSYTYRHSSATRPGAAYEVTATIEWAVTWNVAGAAGGGALPPLRTSAPLAVRVAEMQALNQ